MDRYTIVLPTIAILILSFGGHTINRNDDSWCYPSVEKARIHHQTDERSWPPPKPVFPSSAKAWKPSYNTIDHYYYEGLSSTSHKPKTAWYRDVKQLECQTNHVGRDITGLTVHLYTASKAELQKLQALHPHTAFAAKLTKDENNSRGKTNTNMKGMHSALFH